jgi:formylglycine-generating enzyme required for sulfatase activity
MATRASTVLAASAVVIVAVLLALRANGETGGPDAATAVAPDPQLAKRAVGEMVLIKAGTFTMGSPPTEPGRWRDEVQHQVTLTHDFSMQATELTAGQLAILDRLRAAPSEPDLPAGDVSWHEAAAACNRLSELAGLAPCYTCRGKAPQLLCHRDTRYASPYLCPGYRLPTEAEWEYAARAGTTGVRYGELDAIAWHGENSRGVLHPGRQKQPNAWGLYDLLGNVIEWCDDYFGYQGFTVAAVTDPPGRRHGAQRVHRGGSAGTSFPADMMRAAARSACPPDFRGGFVGFRVVRTAP